MQLVAIWRLMVLVKITYNKMGRTNLNENHSTSPGQMKTQTVKSVVNALNQNFIATFAKRQITTLTNIEQLSIQMHSNLQQV